MEDTNTTGPGPTPKVNVEGTEPVSTTAPTSTSMEINQPPPPPPSTSSSSYFPGRKANKKKAVNNCGEEGDVSASVRVIADNHAAIKARLESSEKELKEAEALLSQMTDNWILEEEKSLRADERLLEVNEKLLKKKQLLKINDRLYGEKVKELVHVRCTIERAEKQSQLIDTSYTDFTVERAIRKDQFAMSDKENAAGTSFEGAQETEQLKNDISKLEDYKERLAGGDQSLEWIQSGEKLIELELRRNGIRDAFERRDANVEAIYMEIDEKNETFESLSRSILIKEKGNKAKVRKFLREVQDKEENLRHLKQAADYLGKQIDPAVSKGPLNTSNVGGGGQNSYYFKSSK